MKTPNCLSTKDQQRPERDFQSRKGYQGLCNFRANGIENIFLDLSPQAVFHQTNVCKQPIADLKRHIPIINICWQGWRCDGAIQARSLLNLLRVAGHNQIPQIVQNFKYRQGLGGCPMRWQLPHGATIAFFL